MALTRQLTRSLTRSLTRKLTGEELNRLFLEKFKLTLSNTELVTNGTFDADSNWSKNTGWTISGGVANSDGTTSGSDLYQNVGISAGKTYNISIDVKSITSGSVNLLWYNGSSFPTIKSALPLGVSSYTFTATSGTNGNIYVNSTNFAGTVDNVSVKEVIKQAPVAAFSLRKLGDVSPYAARIRRSSDNTEAQVMFDASDRVSESSVVRNTSQNLIPFSESFSNSDWTKINAAVTTSTITDPFGGTNAYKYAEINTANNNKLLIDTFAVSSGKSYSFSIYAKKGELDVIQLILGSVTYAGGNNHANFNLTSGTVTATGGGCVAKIEEVGTEGWYRCSITDTTSASGNTEAVIGLYNSPTAGRASTYAGNGADGIYIFGGQGEETVAYETINADIAVNGDFEADTTWNDFGSPVTQNQSTEQVHGGTYSRKVVSSANTKGIQSQTHFSLTGGRTYKVSFWAYAVDGGGDAGVKSGIGNTDQSVFTNRPVTQGQWTNITYDAVATSTVQAGSYISFLTNGDTTTFYVDDLTIEETSPIPSEYISTPTVSNDGLTFTESTLDTFVGGENLRKYSNEFNNASWGINNFNTPVNNNLANPVNGAVDSIKLVAYDTGGASKHEFYTRYSATSGVQYAHSIYLKPFGTLTHVIGSDSGSSGRAAAFDLVNGTVVSNGLSNQGASIEAVGSDGWMRVTFVFTANSTNSDAYIYWAVGDSASLVSGNARTDNYDADGTGQGVYAWGAQVNLGTTAKAHSKTEATIRDGNASVVVLYNQTGGEDAIQATTAHQPLLYNAGLLVRSGTSPSMDFADAHHLEIDSLIGISVLDSYYLTDSDDTRYSMPASQAGAASGLFFRDGSSTSVLGSSDYGANRSIFVNGAALSPTTRDGLYEQSKGRSLVTHLNCATTHAGWGTFNIGIWGFGSSDNFEGKISEMIFFDSNQSSNKTAIEADINDFHNIF